MNQTRQLHNRHTGERLHLTRGVEDGREVLYLEGSLPPHSEGPPMHVHVDQDESGEVIGGRLSAIVGGKTITLGPGERAFFPRGVRHRWWNAGDERLEFNGWAKPVVDLDRFLQAIFEIVNAGPPGRPSLYYLAHAALRHRKTQRLTAPPAAVQAVLFRAVVGLGTALGKYRGEDWPGCPARCSGAPLAAAE